LRAVLFFFSGRDSAMAHRIPDNLSARGLPLP
jgi:hypothetical protein